MRVLGIDCGTERTGYGMIDSDGLSHRLVIAGVIRTSARDPLSTRLLEIGAGLRKIICEFHPDGGAIEEVFHAVNVKTALKLCHVRGVAMMVIAEAGISLGEYSPLAIKTSVVGYGRAEKQQVQLMVCSLLKLDRQIESEDASDAIAVAICHATHLSSIARIGAVAR
ncbi:MAG: crossover junction endodeoxyribonuclease RuvC [Bryobacteraceae bacterium]